MDGGGGGAGRAAGRLCPPPYRPACVTKETQGVWAVDPSTEEQPALRRFLAPPDKSPPRNRVHLCSLAPRGQGCPLHGAPESQEANRRVPGDLCVWG